MPKTAVDEYRYLRPRKDDIRLATEAWQRPAVFKEPQA
jgi:hypothetical protein